MSEANCPDQKQLLEYLSGRLDRQKSNHLSDHIDTCAICNATISTLNPGPDKLVGGLQNVVSSSFAAEPECSGVVQRIAAQSPPAATVGGSSSTGAALIGEGAMLRDYRLFEQIGRGGMGAVHRAEHVRLKRPVAIKLLLTDRLQDDSAIARFNREMEAVGKLDHANIVRATDAGDHDGTHFLVMELVDGPNLSQIARTVGPLRVADACELVRQAAEGLQHAYEHGLVHRDIKPSNLLLSDGRPSPSSATGSSAVKILDLGLALLRENPTDQDELTSSGQIMGTLDYMAPEQASDTHGVDIRADLYSLGCTLYHLLAGSPPFSGSQYSTILKKMMAHAQTPVPPLSNVRSDVPPELLTILDRLLAKEPSERYATPAEVAAALQPFASDAELPALLDNWRDAAQSIADDSVPQSTVVPVSSAQSDTLIPETLQTPSEAEAQRGPHPILDPASLAPTIMVEPEPILARRHHGGSGQRRRLWQALAGLGGILLLGIVFFVGTGEGRVELTVNHKDIQVSVDGEPQEIRVMDGANGEYRIELPNIPAGRRELIVSRDGFSAETRHFWITRSGTRTFEIKVSPETMSDHSISDQALHGAGGELSVAKWVLSLGGKISTDIKGSWMTAIPDLPQEAFHIEKIEVPGVSVTDADIARLRSCSQLARFTCGGSSISDDGLKRLSELKLPLTFLAIHSCGISDDGLRHLKSMKTLSSLTFTATRIGDTGIATIAANHPMLTSLFVGSTAITDACVPELEKLTRLKRLNIDRTRISSRGVQRLRAALPDTEIVTDGGSLTPLSERGPSYALRFQGGADAVTVSDRRVRDSEQFTFEAWIRLDSLPQTQHQATCLYKDVGGVGGDNIWVTHEGRLTYRIDRRSSTDEAVKPGGNMSMVSAGPLPMGDWIHVAAVRDGKLARLFVDGELLAHMLIPPARDVERTGFALGKSWHADARYGDLKIGWVRISWLARYSKDFMPGITDKADGETVALYLFDDGQGEILHDASGHGFDGVIEGAKWVNGSFEATRTAKLSPADPDQRLVRWIQNQGGELFANGQQVSLPFLGDLQHKEVKVVLGGLRADGKDLREFAELVPPSIAPLDLTIEDASITAELLTPLSNLSQLRRLTIQGGNIRLPDLAALKSTSLSVLTLLDVELHQEGPGPSTLGGLSNLATFQLITPSESLNSQISNEILEQIGHSLKRLTHLTLSGLSDTGLKASERLPELLVLEVNDSSISDTGLSAIARNYPKLESLKLSGSPVTGKTLSQLASLEHLSTLNLSDCRRIDDKGFSRLALLPALKRLNVSATTFGDHDIGAIQQLSNLSAVSAQKTRLTDQGLQQLAAIPTLQSIDVCGCPVSVAGVASLLTKRPTCQVQSDFSEEQILNAMGREGRDQRFAQWVLDRGGKLLSTDTHTAILVAEEAPGRGANFAVDFSAVSDFGDDDLRIMNSLRPARPIDLILRNTAVTDAGLAAIQGFPCWIVDLAGTSVTDRSAAVLATIPRLHILDLSGTRMTGASLAELKSLPELENLRLEGVPVSDDEFQSLDGCDLKILIFSEKSADAARSITDRSMPVIGRMVNLERLTLPDSITDEGLQQLRTLTGLKVFRCTGNQITDRSASILAGFRVLDQLELFNARITEKTIDGMSNEDTLTHLILYDANQIAPEALGRLKQFQKLHTLNLDRTQLNNEQLAELSELPLVERLSLRDTAIDNAGVDSLSRWKSLRSLDVTGTQISGDGLKRLREALPDCVIKAD